MSTSNGKDVGNYKTLFSLLKKYKSVDKQFMWSIISDVAVNYLTIAQKRVRV